MVLPMTGRLVMEVMIDVTDQHTYKYGIGLACGMLFTTICLYEMEIVNMVETMSYKIKSLTI